MFKTQEMTELEIRKRQLLAASQVNRQLLVFQTGQLQAAAGWVDRGYRLAQSLGPGFKFALPIAGLLLVRKRSGERSLLAKAFAGWQFARKAAGLWRAIRTPGE